jgi:hypothetical protein
MDRSLSDGKRQIPSTEASVISEDIHRPLPATRIEALSQLTGQTTREDARKIIFPKFFVRK